MRKRLVRKNLYKFYVRDGLYNNIWCDLANNRWEPATFKIFDRFISPLHSYIDVGAWIGTTVLYAAQKARKTYAIEPDIVAFKELSDNVSLNLSLKPKIICLNIALSSKRGLSKLYYQGSAGDSMSSLLARENASNKFVYIKSLTVAELAKKFTITDLNFIKMDIEGGEYFLIPSMATFLEQNKPTLYLSLHPYFLTENLLFEIAKKRIIVRQLLELPLVRKILLSGLIFFSMLRLVKTLNIYRHLYDEWGNPIPKWKLLFIPKFISSTGSIVATNEKW